MFGDYPPSFLPAEEAKKNNAIILIHCMAGISRSVTLTIAYLMSHFRMSMQNAYQFVKDKRPAISPNLNFMGQLVEFERELELNPSQHGNVEDLSNWLPNAAQQKLSVILSERIIRTSSVSSLGSISSPLSPPEKDGVRPSDSVSAQPPPFLLKPVNPRGKRGKKFKEALSMDSEPLEPVRSGSPGDCGRVSSSLIRLNLVEQAATDERKESPPEVRQQTSQERLISSSLQ